MKLRILTLLAVLCALLPARAAESLTALLPADPMFFMSMRDNNLFESLDEHPIAKIMRESGLKKIFSPILKMYGEGRERSEKIYKEETGLTVPELRKVFNGGMAFGMQMDFGKMIGDMKAKGPNAVQLSPYEYFDFVVAVNCTGDEALMEKIARSYGRSMKEASEMAQKTIALPPDAQKPASFPDDYDGSTDDYAGVKLHLWKLRQASKVSIPNPCYALLDGRLIVSSTERGLREAVDRVKKSGASLADSARHRQVENLTKDADITAYLDVASIMKGAMEMVAKERTMSSAQGLAIMRALGLQKLDCLYLTLDVSKNRADAEYGLTFHDQPGIMKILAMDGPGTVPAFIPPDADSAGFGTLHLDRVLAGIEAVVKEGMPMMGDMIGTQIDEFKRQTGVDIRKDLIANIGPDIWTAGASVAEQNGKKDEDGVDITDSTLIAFKIKNRSALELALDTIINKTAPDAALFEKREYQGHTIRNIKGAPMSYLFTDDWIILSIGAPNLLEKILTRMGRGGDDHLFATPGVKATFTGLPGGDDGSTYMDLGSTADHLLGLLKKADAIPPLKAFINLDDPPKKLNLPIVIGARQYHDENSFRVRAHFSEKAK